MEGFTTLHREEIIEMLEEHFAVTDFVDISIIELKDRTTDELLDLLHKIYFE